MFSKIGFLKIRFQNVENVGTMCEFEKFNQMTSSASAMIWRTALRRRTSTDTRSASAWATSDAFSSGGRETGMVTAIKDAAPRGSKLQPHCKLIPTEMAVLRKNLIQSTHGSSRG